MASPAKRLWAYLSRRKKIWLLPLLLVAGCFLILFALLQWQADATFSYTPF